MVRSTTSRRALFAALTALLLLSSAPASPAGAATNGEVRTRICDIDWKKGTWHIKKLIRCAARHWDSPGTPKKAVRVARCESRLRPDAYNANGYAGLFQQATRYWPDRAERFGVPDRSVFNGRANVIVSIRMAKGIGSWNAWGGCA
ncbi:MAG TPA: hypothetical protein VE669_08920 [Actinomycetota bacterium]|nr:hypothetical protein [Actinomycetota bacterium]